MGFTFRFEALLSYRRHLKEKAELEFSRSLKSLTQSRELLRTYEQTLINEKSDLSTSLKGRMTTDEFLNHLDFLSGLEMKIDHQAQEVSRWEEEINEKRKFLLEETTKYRVIEKLKEKDFKKWKDQQLRLEQKRMDEVTLIRFGRDFP